MWLSTLLSGPAHLAGGGSAGWAPGRASPLGRGAPALASGRSGWDPHPSRVPEPVKRGDGPLQCPPLPSVFPAPSPGPGGWWKCPGPKWAQATVTLTPTHAQAFTHMHTQNGQPPHLLTHLGTCTQVLHTHPCTQTHPHLLLPPHPHTCTLTAPHHSAHVSCLLPGKDSAWRVQAAAGGGDGAGRGLRSSVQPPGPQECPRLPLRG